VPPPPRSAERRRQDPNRPPDPLRTSNISRTNRTHRENAGALGEVVSLPGCVRRRPRSRPGGDSVSEDRINGGSSRAGEKRGLCQQTVSSNATGGLAPHHDATLRQSAGLRRSCEERGRARGCEPARLRSHRRGQGFESPQLHQHKRSPGSRACRRLPEIRQKITDRAFDTTVSVGRSGSVSRGGGPRRPAGRWSERTPETAVSAVAEAVYPRSELGLAVPSEVVSSLV
jgi:hypothetical protein